LNIDLRRAVEIELLNHAGNLFADEFVEISGILIRPNGHPWHPSDDLEGFLYRIEQPCIAVRLLRLLVDLLTFHGRVREQIIHALCVILDRLFERALFGQGFHLLQCILGLPCRLFARRMHA